MMDWDGLDAFVVFAEQLNFTKAAKSLRISQPALHAKIQRFASRLEVPLYRREGRRLLLTREGEEVARFGREQRILTSSFLSGLRGEEDVQPVVLIAGEGAYLYLLGEKIRAFLGGSGRHLRLLTGGRDDVLRALRSGEAQLGVAVLDGLPDDLVSVLLLETGYVLACPASHPLASREVVSLDDLEGLSLVVPPKGRPLRTKLEALAGAPGAHWSVAVEAGGWPLMLQFVSMGVGMAVVNGSCALPMGVVGVPFPALGTLRYYLLHRPGARRRTGVELLCVSLCGEGQELVSS